MDTTNLDGFYQVVDDITGLYYDSMKGYTTNYKNMIEWQQKFADEYNITMEQLDKTGMSYGKGTPEPGKGPDHPDTLKLFTYITTQGINKDNNKPGGKNHVVMGNMAICQIYSYWEDYYRALVAKDLDSSKNNFISDILGDIRLLRNSIVHHRAIALADIKKCIHTKWFSEGDLITIDIDKFETIIRLVKNEIEYFRSLYAVLD
jgi:hypothetical protein